MHIFDNVISKEECDKYIRLIDEVYNERLESGMDPISFSTRLINIDEPIIDYVKGYLEERVNIKLDHRWTQLQYWPVGIHSVRHIHTDARAGDTNYTSMLYLNDDFQGGEFFTDDMVIKPRPGKLTLFNGREVYHGVNTVKEKPRYSIIFWWNTPTETFL